MKRYLFRLVGVSVPKKVALQLRELRQRVTIRGWTFVDGNIFWRLEKK